MKIKILTLLMLMIFSVSISAEVKNGEAAPDFTLMDLMDEDKSLSDFENKIVVLEWLNYNCPFVKKHYDSKNMQNLQSKYAANPDVVWLTISSTNPNDKANYLDAAQTDFKSKEYGSAADHIMLDADGAVGRLYGAKTTPHMFIIDKQGTLVYQGAIDSIPSASQDDIADATNYVDQALTELLADKPVSVASTKAYGCSVKY